MPVNTQAHSSIDMHHSSCDTGSLRGRSGIEPDNLRYIHFVQQRPTISLFPASLQILSPISTASSLSSPTGRTHQLQGFKRSRPITPFRSHPARLPAPETNPNTSPDKPSLPSAPRQLPPLNLKLIIPLIPLPGMQTRTPHVPAPLPLLAQLPDTPHVFPSASAAPRRAVAEGAGLPAVHADCFAAEASAGGGGSGAEIASGTEAVVGLREGRAAGVGHVAGGGRAAAGSGSSLLILETGALG